ncbi:MAG: nitroreductase [Nitrospirae bacterium]|nr:nitroreductase [Nitrospirota bacterium]
MDAIECIQKRMSIRKFNPDPVPKETLLNIIDIARRSPSYKNSQPWEAVIISGSKKEELSNLLIGLLERGETAKPDLPEPVSWPPEIDKRIKEHFAKRSTLLGIDISQFDIYVKKAKAANFKFYGAPHAIFLYQDSSLTPWSILDIGMFAQSIMLTACAYGLGTVPQAFLTDYSAEIKKFLGIPESKRLILGISIGYPDMTDKVNSYRSSRADISGILKWVE